MGFCPGTLSWFLTSKSGPAGNQHLLRNWPPNQNVWFQRNIYAAVISIIFYRLKLKPALATKNQESVWWKRSGRDFRTRSSVGSLLQKNVFRLTRNISTDPQ